MRIGEIMPVGIRIGRVIGFFLGDPLAGPVEDQLHVRGRGQGGGIDAAALRRKTGHPVSAA
ncbi:hypothetical protein D3C73_1575780 [compost metagenome]